MMTRRTTTSAARALFATAAIVTLGGCAMKGDIRDLQAELTALAARQDSLLMQLRMEAMSTQDTLRTQSDQIFDFRGDITRELRNISESLARIEALAGENQSGLRRVRDQLANMRTQTVTRPQGPVSDSSAVGGMAPGGGNPVQLYQTALDQMNRGSLTTARMAFEQFLQEHPNHEYAPDAHFYLADVLLQQENYDDALEGFREVQTRFPTAARVPDAMYRIALIHIEQEDIDDAIEMLERIINTYPDEVIAELAAERLGEIR